VKVAASIAFTLLAVCAATASGATVAGRIVFAANNAPAWSGHIYISRGRGLIDLSARSAGLDFTPAVSPDGTRIAFASYRGGHLAVYVMRADGSDVVRVSPFLGAGGPNGNAVVQTITWRPDSRVVAVLVFSRLTAKGAVYVASPSGGWRLIVPTRRAPAIVGGWTAGGLLLYVSPDTGGVEGVDASGRTRFDVPGEAVAASPRGSIAVQRDSRTWLLYSAAGREVARLPNVAAARWSPNGALLATTSASGDLRIRDAAGKEAAARFPHAQVVGWLGNRIVRLEGGNGIFGVSALTAKRVSLRVAFRQYSLVSSGTRVAAVLYPASFKAGNVARLIAGSVGGPARNVATFPICSDEPVVSDLQLFGTNGLAYATACTAPAADVYAVSPSGAGLQRLTTSPYDDAEPAVSPDGTTIAYVQKDNEMHCSGCPETLWAMNADGSGARRFPNSSSEDLPYDDGPSFSPDGKSILFVRSGPNATGLFTVPTAGGPAHDLKLPGTGAVWGPSRIVYNAWPSGKPTTVAPDGSGKALVSGAGAGGTAAWSTDGRLAYLQTDQRGRLSILLPASGGRIELPQLTGAYASGLAWSPDGTRFAFVAADASGLSDVWTIRVDGTHLTRVTHALGAVTSLSWR
jgi:Tol biopolymer transport system component